MKKIIILILFLAFAFSIGRAYSFNYKSAKCALVPLSHSLKLKFSAGVYGIAKKYVPSNKDNGHFLVKSVFANHGITYTVVGEREFFPPVNSIFDAFLLRNGDLMGTYSVLYTGLYYKHGDKFSSLVAFSPPIICGNPGNINNLEDYTWSYYPTVPARVEKESAGVYHRSRFEGIEYIHHHIVEYHPRTYNLR